MLGKFFECEANRNDKYYRVIQTEKEYSDGRRFPLNEVVVADNKVNLNATDNTKMGGFCISSYEYIFINHGFNQYTFVGKYPTIDRR